MSKVNKELVQTHLLKVVLVLMLTLLTAMMNDMDGGDQQG